MVKLADTLDLGSSSRECRFKSCYPHQKSKLFSPACEHVLGAHGAPAELRRRKEFFLIFAELKLRCGNVVYMKRRVWFLIVTKPLLPAFGQVGEKGGTGRRRVNQYFCIDFLFCVHNVNKRISRFETYAGVTEDLFRERELLRSPRTCFVSESFRSPEELSIAFS